MAKRERERITERTRPHRREAPRRGGAAPPDSWSNPVVLVAAGGLLLAVILAAGFLLGRGAAPGAPTTAETPAVTGLPTVESAAGEQEQGAAETAAPPYPQFEAPEDQGLDPENKAYFATIQTPHGPIVIQLWPQIAPQTVNSFVFLARQGFYDGLTFHRVEPDFVIQGGDPAGTGTGGPGYSLPAEFNADNPVPHRMGTVAMARTADPNSAGSQFYIVTKDSASASALDGKYTVFGQVIEGMDAVWAMQRGDVMSKVTIEEKPISESVISPDDVRAGNLPDYGTPPGEEAEGAGGAGQGEEATPTGEAQAEEGGG